MGEQKHTALPWRVTEDERGQIIRATDSTGKPIASMWANGSDPKENAELIVRAVNTYPAVADLVEALEVLMATMPKSQDRPPLVSMGQWHAARSALTRFRSLSTGEAQ